MTLLPNELREALRAGFVIEDGHGIGPEAIAQVITALRGEVGPRVKPVEAAGLLADLAHQGLLLPWDGFYGASIYLLPWEIQAKVPPLPGWCPASTRCPAYQVSNPEEQDVTEFLSRVWHQIALEPPLLRLHPHPGLNAQPALPVQDWPVSEAGTARLQQEQGNRRGQTAQSLTVPPAQTLLDDASLSRLAHLTAISAEKVEFAVRLLHEMGLAEEREARLVPQHDAQQQYACKTPAQRRRDIAQAYMSMLGWSELDMLLRSDHRWVLRRNAYFSVPYVRFRSHLIRARQMMLRLLATAGEGRWCALEELESALLRLWPEFFQLHSLGEVHSWRTAFQLKLRSSHHDTQARDHLPQSAFFRAILLGPLQWLGFVDVCVEQGEPAAIRSHGLRNLLWASPEADRRLPATQPVTFDLPSDTIAVLTHAVDPDVPTFLGQIAYLESVDGDRFIYRLDMRAAHVAFDRGKSLAELESEWQQVMGQPLPDVFHRTLQEWWARYGEVRLYDGFALLEVDDHVTLRELEATTSLGKHIVARVSPRVVLVPDARVDDLLVEMRAKGHMPRQVG